MRGVVSAAAVALIALLTTAASTALAQGDYQRGSWDDGSKRHDWKRNKGAVKCNGTRTRVTIRDDVVVPANGKCTLIDSVVKGSVEVRRNAYFQANDTSIRGGVEADRAQTVFIDGKSHVGDDVEISRTAQVFLFDSKIDGAIGVFRATDKVHVCGNVVRAGIRVIRSGSDILVGDPLAVDCDGNRVTRGSVLLSKNNTHIELVVRGNAIPKGNLQVIGNTGPAAKFVQQNTGGKTIRCTGNSAPFSGSANDGWKNEHGQCNG